MLKTKDASVKMDGVDPRLLACEPILKTAWLMYGLECVVTSAKDGSHSVNSAHYKGLAFDLRIIGISLQVTPMAFGLQLSRALVECLGPFYYVVLESDHIHLEVSTGTPNIKWFKFGTYFYAQTIPKAKA